MAIELMTVAEQLTYIYHTEENWHSNKLHIDDANKYHQKLLDQGNILTYIQDDQVLGYVEFWRLNYNQWGRLVCGERVNIEEGITSGNIAYVNNGWIDSNYRGGFVYRHLHDLYFAANKDCDYFTAFRRIKKHQPVIIYNKKDIKLMVNNEGVLNGR